jgi:hypothetical protein
VAGRSLRWRVAAGLMQADAYAGFQPAVRDGTQTGTDHRGGVLFRRRERQPFPDCSVIQITEGCLSRLYIFH